MMIGSVRHASYSKNPQMKDGSLRALIYNDAQYKGKQHLLRDEFNPNRIGKPEVPASWKIEGKVETNIEPRGYGTQQLTIDQKYSLPDHQYCYFATPFLGGDRGGMINQKIRYEELLPRCAGKLHKLEWSHLTEEDRYTKRNYLIREAQRRNDETADLNGANDQSEGHSWGANGYNMKVFSVVLFALVFWGLPGSNSRSINGLDPNNQSETFKDENWAASIPIFGPLFLDLAINMAPSLPIRDGHYGYSSRKVSSVPLWTETDKDLRSLSGHERNTMTSSSATHYRDVLNIPRVPKQQWLETNTLYYDDAEGPDRIGNYNVHPWKTAGEDSYQNAKMSGDTVDGYTCITNKGICDSKG